ncbi:hypothetical protein BVRB_1g011280 [Beta vulgaris subsp. vulgaris]|nr:hypothetical protein BVRB_1g011280 [Beta vulgaris subsp. vulgaris]
MSQQRHRRLRKDNDRMILSICLSDSLSLKSDSLNLSSNILFSSVVLN